MAARGGSRQREPLRAPRGKGSATQARTAPKAVSNDLDLAAAYNEYRPAILRYLRRRTGDVQLAEELMQDVFLAALVAQPSLSTARTPLLAWLYVVARRRAIDAARSARRTPRAAQAALDDVSVAYAVDDGRVSARAITDAISVLGAGGGELDRERQPVQTFTDTNDGLLLRGSWQEVRIGLACALVEERDGGLL